MFVTDDRTNMSLVGGRPWDQAKLPACFRLVHVKFLLMHKNVMMVKFLVRSLLKVAGEPQGQQV